MAGIMSQDLAGPETAAVVPPSSFGRRLRQTVRTPLGASALTAAVRRN